MSASRLVPFGLILRLSLVVAFGCMCLSHVNALFESPIYRLTTVAGANNTNGIPATSYAVTDQLGALTWKDGQLYFVEGNYIKKVDKNGNVYTIGGNPRIPISSNTFNYDNSIMATYASFTSYIPSIAIDPNNEFLYVLDMGNSMLRRISFKTGIVSLLYTFPDSEARSLQILNERELMYSASGRNSYRKLDIRTSNDTFILPLPMSSQETKFVNETLYALDVEMGALYKVYKNGTYTRLFQATNLNGHFDVDFNGNVYFSADNYKIFRFNTSGQIEQIAGIAEGFGGDGSLASGSKISYVGDMIVNDLGELIFADVGNSRIRKIDKNGIISTIVGRSVLQTGQAPLLSSFSRIDGFAFHPNGMYFSDNGDSWDYKILKSLKNGIITPVLNTQVGSMVADSSGALYFLLPTENLVKLVNNSIVQTLAGDEMTSNIRDGVSGVSSSVPSPSGISLYNNNIYVSSGNRIRIIYQNLTIDSVYIGSEDIISLFVSSDGNMYFLGSSTLAIHKVLNKTSAIRIVGGGIDTGNTLIQSLDAKLDNPTSFYVTKTKDFIIGELQTIRISMNGGYITPLLYVEEGMNNPPSFYLDSPKSIQVKESTYLEISFASKGNVFTLVRELNETCYGVKASDGTVCSGRGNCILYNYCTCESGFEGPNCELTSCNGILSNDPRVCNGKGQCLDSRTCQCESGFGGDFCDQRNMSCFGVAAYLSNTCSGNGNCTQQDQCLCSLYYFGPLCEYTTCFGQVSNSPNVCNQNGNCTNFNSCTCKSGFTGLNCNITYCNDLSNADPLVCNSRGQCVASDTCKCNSGYLGKYCQDFSCFGIHFKNESACSGRGVCKEYDSCQCDGSTGSQCQVELCFGQPGDSPQVCNYGNGTCIGNDQCSCRAGWVGKDCSNPFCFGSFKENFTCLAPSVVQQDSNKEIVLKTISVVSDLNSLLVNFTKFEELSVKLPSSMSVYLNETNQLPKSDISIVASVTKDESKGQVLSSVITLSIVSNNQALKISQLTEPIQISFGKVHIPKANMTLFNLTCAFYDYSTQSWNSEGLTTGFEYSSEETIQGILYHVQFITCYTSHLTSFSIIDKNYKKANTEYKGMPEPSQLRNDLISLNNEQIIILATTLGGSFIIILTVTILIVVVIALVLRARRRKLRGSYTKSSSRCSCC